MNSNLMVLLKNDLKTTLRDPMNLALTLLPLILALLFRFLIPWLTEVLAPLVDLSGSSLWLGFLLMAGPIMYGWVGGFLLLEEKDQGLLPILSVLPVSRNQRLAVKSLLPSLAAIPGTFLIILISGMAPAYLHRYWLVAVLAALQSPLMTLLLASLGKTKVQGVTLAKTLMILFMPPMALPFVNHPLIHLTALSPPYWVLESFRTAVGGEKTFWLYVFGGLVYFGILMAVLFKLARKEAV